MMFKELIIVFIVLIFSFISFNILYNIVFNFLIKLKKLLYFKKFEKIMKKGDDDE